MSFTTILIYVTCACVGGFMFLLGWVIKLGRDMEKRATFEWCEDKLVMKDVLDVRLKSIEDLIDKIEKAISKLADNAKD